MKYSLWALELEEIWLNQFSSRIRNVALDKLLNFMEPLPLNGNALWSECVLQKFMLNFNFQGDGIRRWNLIGP